MKAMLLCAGEGTRLRPLTLSTPKPAVEFLQVPMACYSLALLDDLKVDGLVVNTYHLPEKIRELFQALNLDHRSLNFTSENPLLGSGGGIHNAQKYLQDSENFIVTNGDEVIFPHEPYLLREMLKFHEWHKGIATLLTIRSDEVGKKFGGAWVSGELNRVKFFSKTPVEGLQGLHFIGVMIFKKSIFNYFKNPVQEENILYETLTLAMQKGEEVFCYDCKAEWFETGNLPDLTKAQEICGEALKKSPHEGWVRHLQQVIHRYKK